jgi:hypothetical protein
VGTSVQHMGSCVSPVPCSGSQRDHRCPFISEHLPLPLVSSRCFKISCRAVGVHPPLELSHYQIKFAATALYDTSVATVYVINSHLSMNKLTHSLPRIGSEEASPVGPTSFEFLLPPNSPITISPSVGTVLPGKVSIGFTGKQGGRGSRLPCLTLGVPGSATWGVGRGPA